MPHQCTNCGRTFADGSKEMLSGCPDCGGNKFQFAPTATAAAESSAGTETDTDDSGSVDTASTSAQSSAGESDGVATRAAETVRDWMSTGSGDEPTTDAAERSRSDDSTATSAAAANQSWPASEDAAAPESDTSPDGEFDEWPETARRPEDRSGSPDETAADAATEAGSADRTRSDGDWPDQPSSGPTATMADDENSAQADARSAVVPSDDLPSHSETPGRDSETSGRDGSERDPDAGRIADTHTETGPETEAATGTGADDDQPPEHGRVVSEPSGQRPSIEELRAELNEQFESIKIVRPGQYELNLMELYNRDEYIISLQEDGRYVIDVPDSWHAGDDGED
ncbi:Zn-ribbon containing protein [Natrinema versiforme]|uniref:Origin-associated protein OapC n=1 Tax=Natrinema versiforme TaxID=88724 RepID=A0A4P8WM38_9EURY|nr:Zn-ribbon containing protein [Natrinema versiforme]QCS44232.1 hypothetical protein FEJ81_18525 [Natrinema versiforme]